MKIIGYNSSHETSLAQFDSDTWELDFFYEEERFRGIKHYSPTGPMNGTGNNDNVELLCIERKGVETPDHFIGASYDRRVNDWGWNSTASDADWANNDEHNFHFDKIKQREILDFLSEEQLSLARIEAVHKKYKEFIMPDGQSHHWSLPQHDDIIHSKIASQLGLTEFNYEIEHHLYHAECGYYFSPWKEEESAIAITMDGGGASRYMVKEEDSYPNYQEMETIYLCQPDTKPTCQYQRLSNNRFLDRMHGRFFHNEMRDKITSAPAINKEIDGTQVLFNSKPSMGMNFSALAMYFGFDKLGRASGKVMGAASYHHFDNEGDFPDFSIHSMANLLEQKALKYTVKLIQKAVDLNPDCKNIILSGGYALNCTNNAKYLDYFPEHQFFIDPCAHDGGTSIGSAIRLARALNQGEEI